MVISLFSLLFVFKRDLNFLLFWITFSLNLLDSWSNSDSPSAVLLSNFCLENPLNIAPMFAILHMTSDFLERFSQAFLVEGTQKTIAQKKPYYLACSILVNFEEL